MHEDLGQPSNTVMLRVKAGKTLMVNTVAADTQQSVSFPISINGFGSALARTATLSADRTSSTSLQW